MKEPVVRDSKANVSPFSCVLREEMKDLYFWKYGKCLPFSDILSIYEWFGVHCVELVSGH
jgi:hypothetical protein